MASMKHAVDLDHLITLGDRKSVAAGFVILIIISFIIKHWQAVRCDDDLPCFNYGSNFWAKNKAKVAWVKDAPNIIMEGFRKFSGPYRVMTEHGPMVILPPDYIDAINEQDKLSFAHYLQEAFMADTETFRTMRAQAPGLFDELILRNVTRALPKFTKPLSRQMTSSLQATWGQATEWTEFPLQEHVITWVTYLSTRVFLGEQFLGNKRWIELIQGFPTEIFTALNVTLLFHPLLRPLVDRFSPLNRRVRRLLREARSIMRPELDRRHAEIANAEKEGRKPNLPSDSIEWTRQAAHGRWYPEVEIQISLATAAIHTTSDALSQALLDLSIRPELVDALRQEVVDVLTKHNGLTKIALYDLHLMDSFLKESQRLKPLNMASMHRSALADTTLPGGIRIRKGDHVAISSHRMWDNAAYNDAKTFDAFRFVKMRKTPGMEHKSYMVATSPDHLGFSHGKHACPGRFFATNELKITLIHIVLKYDLRVVEKSMVIPMTFGANNVVNPKAKLLVRSRTPEIDLDEMTERLD